MAFFEPLIGDLAGKVGLGPKAEPLVRELLTAILAAPGGLVGFLNGLKGKGLVPELESWVGHADAAPLAPAQLAKVFDGSVLHGIASRLGLAETDLSRAAAAATPKLIGLLTPGGAIPTALPAEVVNFLAPIGAHSQGASEARKFPGWIQTGGGVLAFVALVASLTYLFSGETSAPAPQTQASAPPSAPVAAVPATEPTPASFEFTIGKDKIRVAGAVADEQTRAALLDDLRAAYGAAKVTGDIAVDARRAPADWRAKLRGALESLNIPGLSLLFSGESIAISGQIDDEQRARVAAALASQFGGDVRIGSLEDHLKDVSARANASAASSLSALQPGFSAADLVGALNLSIINFATASNEIPMDNRVLLRSAAARFKQLAPETSIEIAGYTDNTGSAENNLLLSQHRADAVRAVLIAAGVAPAMVVAKGYGGADTVAGNDSFEGRFRNRRIEYHLARP